METKRLMMRGFQMQKKISFFLPERKEHTFIQHHFLFIESFENYVDNVDVEIKAIQLSKSTISLTYYLSQNLTLCEVQS